MHPDRTPAQRTAELPRPLRRKARALGLALIASTVPLAMGTATGPARAMQEDQQAEQPTATDQAAAPEAPPADPCASPEHHQFDFWIGDWEVRDADGKLQGTNRLTTLYGGCVLQEHWQGTGGIEGTSFSLYDAPRDVWHQTWVDSQGSLLELEGGLDGKDMVLRGRRPSSKDPSVEVLHEVRWTPLDDGRVRQHWRASKDDGATWVTVFDGYYAKKS